MTKKLTVIGRGTAGALTASYFLKHMDDCEIEWRYDPNIPVQSVGEGSTPQLLSHLYNTVNFNYLNRDVVNCTSKVGIYKSGWGKGGDFMHQFFPPMIGLHFNAVKLQDFIYDQIKDRVKIVETNVSQGSQIDSDFIVDCSGAPRDFDGFYRSEYIPVNSAYVTQCEWDKPTFDYTLTIARPWGWVFGVPLTNRCSIGYIYNKDITDLDTIKEDVKEVFAEYNLTPSDKTNALSFNNYYRMQNFTDRVFYNGNASFFLEPMEATSIATMDFNNIHGLGVFQGSRSADNANALYRRWMQRIESIIMLHYFAGSKYKTEFWDFARQKAETCIKVTAQTDETFKHIIDYSVAAKDRNMCDPNVLWGYWESSSFCENLYGMGIEKELQEFISC